MSLLVAATLPAMADVLSRQQLEEVFARPADVTTTCYWYWISGNVTPEGVANDVRSMKRAGINRAFMGFQGLSPNEAPHGPVYIQTPQWYECLRSAFATAAEEGVEIGVFNCPGWSQSGGPWVTPMQSQRYLATAATTAVGGKEQTLVLDRPADWLADVAVVAYPDGGERVRPVAIASGEGQLELDFAADGFRPRSVMVTCESPIRGHFSLKGLADGQWREIVAFDADRTNMMIEVGYDRLAPTATAIPAHAADRYRLDYAINADCRNVVATFSEAPVVTAYADKILSKMFQSPHPFWEQYKWEKPFDDGGHYLRAADVVDLSPQLSGDTLRLALPEGNWHIVRLYMAPTGIPNSPALPGDGQGLEIDRWNPDVLRHHYDSFIGDIRRNVPAEMRTTWTTIVSDSYERATQNVGDDFISYFKTHFGYDPTPYLLTYSGVVVESPDKSERFLWDLRRMIADRLAYDHIGGLRDLAHADGLKLWLESYGHWGFPGEFLMYGGQSDEVAGEFWSEGSLGDIENRAASSVAHIYGKGICSSESFTCGSPEYSRSPRSMKQRGDRFFTEGVNSTLLHLYVAQPENADMPGFNCPFGNEFNRKNTWFSHLDLFTDYLKRVNVMLQQGNYVADVAYFIGEDCPSMTGTTTPPLPAGFQYDYINAEVIEKALTAGDDHILRLPHGTAYRVLVLPPLATMRPALLRRIYALVNDGAVVLGPKPLASPSLQDYPHADAEVKALADKLWGVDDNPTPAIRKVGKGLLATGYDLTQLFSLLGVQPDFMAAAPQDADLRYAHCTSAERDIYFISNQRDVPVSFSATFRDGALGDPELWTPTDGRRRALPEYERIGGSTVVPLRLDSYESTFVVFDRSTGALPAASALNYPAATTLCRLDGRWELTLRSMLGEERKCRLDTLLDLSTSDDDALRHFSGTMTYRTTVSLSRQPTARSVMLDLGNVREMAKVKVNGQYAGGLWTPPYRLDITNLLRKGKNTIEIEVVNNWYNRLVGDAALPRDQRATRRIHKSIRATNALQPAGLMGPVTILTAP